MAYGKLLSPIIWFIRSVRPENERGYCIIFISNLNLSLIIYLHTYQHTHTHKDAGTPRTHTYTHIYIYVKSHNIFYQW